MLILSGYDKQLEAAPKCISKIERPEGKEKGHQFYYFA